MFERLKTLRLQNNLSQRAVAEIIGTSQKSIDNWEKGVTEPSASHILKLSDVFNCTCDYLLGREDEFGNIITNCNLSEEEKQILSLYKRCDKKTKESARLYLQFLSEQD